MLVCYTSESLKEQMAEWNQHSQISFISDIVLRFMPSLVSVFSDTNAASQTELTTINYFLFFFFGGVRDTQSFLRGGRRKREIERMIVSPCSTTRHPVVACFSKESVNSEMI